MEKIRLSRLMKKTFIIIALLNILYNTLFIWRTVSNGIQFSSLILVSILFFFILQSSFMFLYKNCKNYLYTLTFIFFILKILVAVFLFYFVIKTSTLYGEREKNDICDFLFVFYLLLWYIVPCFIFLFCISKNKILQR